MRPAHFDIERVIRPKIPALHPYPCARDDYSAGRKLNRSRSLPVRRHVSRNYYSYHRYCDAAQWEPLPRR